MGNEVSAQRVTFGSCPPCRPYTQVQQEASQNTGAPSTKKRKREDSEEDHSIENVRKRRKLLVMDDGSHSILTSESLIVVLKIATTPSLLSRESELTAAGTNPKSKIKESPESTVRFGSKASPDMNESTSSAAEDLGQVFVELKLPKKTKQLIPLHGFRCRIQQEMMVTKRIVVARHRWSS
ncbi:uncharacterized protein EAE97_008039 [Botrytis byssoidea]|uniref:Uncharacterized protein n=1 Tax=Botrytis byssoidea TaxID=139641 RepID=A0A9P5IGU4_9HELO|nr:uncharacterized protein EAE97_008039 [Botrytis byssoidea]KAF7936673.1 hypothetical protein EAE97_008039 [Botrytis byssoidea]